MVQILVDFVSSMEDDVVQLLPAPPPLLHMGVTPTHSVSFTPGVDAAANILYGVSDQTPEDAIPIQTPASSYRHHRPSTAPPGDVNSFGSFSSSSGKPKVEPKPSAPQGEPPPVPPPRIPTIKPGKDTPPPPPPSRPHGQPRHASPLPVGRPLPGSPLPSSPSAGVTPTPFPGVTSPSAGIAAKGLPPSATVMKGIPPPPTKPAPGLRDHSVAGTGGATGRSGGRPMQVNEWLLDLGLPQYINRFFSNGWDNMAHMKVLTKEDLEKMGVCNSHSKTILEGLQKL